MVWCLIKHRIFLVAYSVQRFRYELDDRGSIPGRGNDEIFSLRHRVQTSFPGGKVAGV
jgi:hypothetical protein